jgi:hypothetical protein
MRRLSERLFPPLAGLLALGCAWLAIAAIRHGRSGGFDYAMVMAGEAVLFAAAALSVHFQWKGRRLLAFLCGVPLCLYAASVLLMGWEDVGGAAIALPLVTATALVGVMGLALSAKGTPSDRAT